MTKKELLKWLKDVPDEAEVYIQKGKDNIVLWDTMVSGGYVGKKPPKTGETLFFDPYNLKHNPKTRKNKPCVVLI